MPNLFEQPVSTSNLYAPDFERLWRVFESALDQNGRLIHGSLVFQLEEKLCAYHDAKHCVTFSTGFWALVAAVRSMSLTQRNEVIIPSLTYRRLADVVYWSGNIPVFVDVDPENLAICPEAVEKAITSKTALILAVHPIVNCCDVEQLITLSNNTQIPILFDAVESMHETHNSRRIGSYGVGEVFSLHASKLINGLEAGYVCTNDESLKNELLRFRESSQASNKNQVHPLGLNGILNDGHAAFAIAGLEEVSRNVTHNKLIYDTYLRELRCVDDIRILPFDESQQTSFKNIVAEVGRDYAIGRDELVANMNAEGILARAYYTPALHQKTYQYPVKSSDVAKTEQAVNRYINLPCGQRVSENDVVEICRFLGRKKPIRVGIHSAAQQLLEPSSPVDQQIDVTKADFNYVFKNIYHNQYFTNHGPLAQEFEATLEDYLGIGNAVTIGNESLARLVAMSGLELTGEVVLPAFGGGLVYVITKWLGLKTNFCDVDLKSHQASKQTLASVLSKKTEAVVLVESWGNRCDSSLVDFLCEQDVKVIIVAFDSFASTTNGNFVHGGPNVVTVHSFAPGKILSTLQGGAIACNDDNLAHRFRNIRSSYGVRKKLDVKATCNGRFSEFQAGVGLKSFSFLENIRAHNQNIAEAYSSILGDCEGIKPFDFEFTELRNNQCYPVQVTDRFPASKAELISRIGASNLAQPVDSIETSLCPVSQKLNSQILLLPTGRNMDVNQAVKLAENIGSLQVSPCR